MPKTLKELVSDRANALLLPGAANALSAKIIEDLGFNAVYMSGAGVTNTDMALPDLGFITLDQIVTTVGRMRDVIEIPIVVDIDTGFGNALNVTHCVRALERVGANAIQIEDQLFPKRCGHFEGKEVETLEEMVTKVKAAVDTRKSEDFLVIARTDAVATSGMDEALTRANAFVEAGADIIFVEALTTREDIELIPKQINIPLLINMVEGGKTPILEKVDLEKMGYSVILYANSAMRGAMKGMQDVLKVLLTTGSTNSALNKMVEWSERQRLVGKDKYDEMEVRYKS